ncbi:hypothetical protein [Streptomyces sp. NBC_00280]|uniref:hypothetical protein n=1 Tax=Streptomyces sp. NBC_00280 TaxID=2975699 RepID=UPI00324FBD1E
MPPTRLHAVSVTETGRPLPAVTASGHPRRTGYAPYAEGDFVHRILDGAIGKHLGYDEPHAVVFVRANEDWTSGGVARLAFDLDEIGPVCEQALHQAGYGCEPAPALVSGYGFALRFRRADQQRLCPAVEVHRPISGWDPWSCDLERDHDGVPHHHQVMDYRWVDDTEPPRCGSWAQRPAGHGWGSCGLPAGHPPQQVHRDTLWEALTGVSRPSRSP